ncbi:MAG: peptidase C14 [Deltaproteobacteria bacterium HGW-Deltaproteobacteria-6]|nr:MAG: peptidase C14 [Deltaproteobacteria bacterium HGW-Deltaproteobacteria-6]
MEKLFRACSGISHVFCGIIFLGIFIFAGIQAGEAARPADVTQANQKERGTDNNRYNIQALDLTQADRKEVTVRVAAADAEWKNSGVLVRKGIKYKISASGNWSLGPICGVTGPDGVGNSAICGGVIVKGSGSLLVGKIGEEGDPFAIGSGIQLTAEEDGVLFFNVNGGLKVFCSGQVKVTTAVLSPPPEPVVAHSRKSDIDELPAIKTKPNKNAYAIVIGIEQYRQKLPRADFAVSDAKLMSEYLIKVMGYPEENVVVLVNDHAALGDFVKYFEKWLPNNVEKGGTVLVYYSGHGAPSPKTGDAYLVPYDGDPSFIAETGYSLQRMYEALGKLPAKEIVVALDSCFSGAGGRSVIARGMRPLVMNLQGGLPLSRNITVLSASAGDQISATYDEKGHGLFTYFLLKGIRNEDVVRPDGSIKMDDLFGYIKPQVERIARKQYNNEQTPQLMGAKKN